MCVCVRVISIVCLCAAFPAFLHAIMANMMFINVNVFMLLQILRYFVVETHTHRQT